MRQEKSEKKNRRRKKESQGYGKINKNPKSNSGVSTTDMKSSLEELKAGLSIQKKGSKNLKTGQWK